MLRRPMVPRLLFFLSFGVSVFVRLFRARCPRFPSVWRGISRLFNVFPVCEQRRKGELLVPNLTLTRFAFRLPRFGKLRPTDNSGQGGGRPGRASFVIVTVLPTAARYRLLSRSCGPTGFRRLFPPLTSTSLPEQRGRAIRGVRTVGGVSCL